DETASQPSVLQRIETPSTAGGEPNLFLADDGTLYLSWIEYLNDSLDALKFARLDEAAWSTPREIARSSNWFVNWADFPSLVSYGKAQTLAVHWLQKSAEGTYDYDVHVSQSTDGGDSWSDSFVLHKDGIPAEHGFVSMIPAEEDRVFATWLDGRHTKTGDAIDSHGHGHGGAMTLRGAYFDAGHTIYDDQQLDGRICDCCQTDAAMTNVGPVVVYRDRSEKEVRDIYLVRQEHGKWSTPQPVFEDNWLIAGCPVNGPAISAQGNELAVAWYSRANDKPQVKVAFSSDGGASFSDPVRVDDGDPLGRVDIVSNNGEYIVTWLENEADSTFVKCAGVTQQGVSDKQRLVSISAARSSGFPVLERWQDGFVLAWTAVDAAGDTRIQTAIVNL
ncbi:MAG: hypothetical protein AAFO94_19425, partial [Bacteroidota bacterium]